jgi:hypothetical protein
MSIDEGKGLNPYFEGRFDGESDELRALRLTLARERDEARAEVERLRPLTICGCGDHFAVNFEGTCPNCKWEEKRP